MADKLDILVVSQFFTPEMGAPASRFHDFGRMLVERGHRVRVITGFPNSPSGRIPDTYHGQYHARETIDGIEVMRGWLYVSPRLSPVTKSLGFATYTLSSSLWALLARPPADVVIATSPPPTVGLTGLLASRVLGAPLVFDVRDIWPEAIALSGRLQSGAMIRALEGLERILYRSAAAISVVTEGKRQRLGEKNVSVDLIEVIPNGVDLSRFDDVDEGPATTVFSEFGVDTSRFTILYAGVFNPPQGLDVLLDAAARLREEGPEWEGQLQFVLVGDGSERLRLEARARDEALTEMVRFVSTQPRDMMPPLLSSADAIAVTLRPRKDGHTIPSKIYEAMASGNPVLLSADGAPAAIVRDSEAGFASPAADVDGLVRSIKLLLSKPELVHRMGAKGRAFAARYDRRVLVERFETMLRRVVAENRARR